jgi:5'-methylthioinosine phosphorylase
MRELVPELESVRLAVIGGTGLNRLAGLESLEEHVLETPFGPPSHAVVEGRLGGENCLFLARHGVPHHIPPDRINYRANLWALRALGADAILGINAVGGIRADLAPGRLVVPDQLVDYTWGREHTFFDGEDASGELSGLEHIDFTEPYDRALRQLLLQCAADLGLPCADTGTYGVTQGPRLETAAEIRRLERDGCDLVGMTGMPEAALARELGLRYASLCIVVNPAAGLGQEPITLASMQSALEAGSRQVEQLLSALLKAMDPR